MAIKFKVDIKKIKIGNNPDLRSYLRYSTKDSILNAINMIVVNRNFHVVLYNLTKHRKKVVEESIITKGKNKGKKIRTVIPPYWEANVYIIQKKYVKNYKQKSRNFDLELYIKV